MQSPKGKKKRSINYFYCFAITVDFSAGAVSFILISIAISSFLFGIMGAMPSTMQTANINANNKIRKYRMSCLTMLIHYQ